MSFAPAILLGLALSAPAPSAPAAPAPAAPAPAAPATRPPPRAPAQPPITCSRYRVQAEKNDLGADADVAGWITGALERASLLDPRSPCYVHVRITAGPTRMSGKEDGWVAHVSLSTRRMQKEGRLLTREKGKLFIESLREVVVWRVRTFVEEFMEGLVSAATPAGREAPPFTDEG